MKLRLLNTANSSPSHRVRIALALKGLDYEYVAVDLRKQAHKAADYVALNPQGLLPTLEVDGVPLAQTIAIVEWLEETFPNLPLLPSEALARAKVRRVAAMIATDITPLHSMRVSKAILKDLGQTPDVLRAWAQRWMSEGFAAVERVIDPHGAFCFGDEPTMADVFLVPAVHIAKVTGVDITAFPRIAAIDARAAEHRAFVAAHPSRQPDA
ncbi:MAG: maleylacetoacetate isomerase [Alphaproteobacteria bacterium]|nr:maleylacetoacetate isomerase [Alphaproteobacteria bacterium]